MTIRSYPELMRLPLFPELSKNAEAANKSFEASLPGGLTFKMSVHNPELTLALPTDRKLLAGIAAYLADQIRQGHDDRNLDIPVIYLLRLTEGQRSFGGEDYIRLQERVQRLFDTKIELHEPLANGNWRIQNFRWIDKLDFEGTKRQISEATKSIKIRLSEECYAAMAYGLGYDTSSEAYVSVVSQTSSTWRIYEICLGTLMVSEPGPLPVSISDLYQRIPMQCGLKVFKARALKRAIETINSHAEMSKRIHLSLRYRAGDQYVELPPSKRVPLDTVYLWATPGDLSAIKTDRLLENHGNKTEMLF